MEKPRISLLPLLYLDSVPQDILPAWVTLVLETPTQPSRLPRRCRQLPGGQLVRHHDAVIRVGHQQPDGVLQDALNELLTFLRVCDHFCFVIILRGVNASKVFAGVTCITTAFKDVKSKSL